MNMVEASCCSHFYVFKPFYNQNAVHIHRHGASREASGSSGATFSDVVLHPGAPVSVFVVFGAPLDSWSQRHALFVFLKMVRFCNAFILKLCCRSKILLTLSRKPLRELKNNVRIRCFEDCCFCSQNKLEIATCEADLGIRVVLY